MAEDIAKALLRRRLGGPKKYIPIISVSTVVTGSRFEPDTSRIHVINVSC